MSNERPLTKITILALATSLALMLGACGQGAAGVEDDSRPATHQSTTTSPNC